MAHPVKLFLGREPPTVRPLVDDRVAEARGFERVQDRRNGREPIPVNCQEAREGLLQNPESTRGHVGCCDDHPMRNPGDLAQGRRIAPEMMEHHDEHREIERICAKREAATIAPHAFERALGAGDPEHGRLRIDGDNRIGLTEELGKTAGSRSDVEDALPILQAAHLDEPAKPKLAVGHLVGAISVVVCGTSRIVYRHTSCKREAANEDAEVNR